jgi:rhodanese-related sulfurtransferase
MFANTIKEIEAFELAQWVSDPKHVLRVIDVRELHEIATGKMPQAEALPLGTLPANVHALSKHEKLVIVCRSGARSAHACQFLQQNGFSNVYNLRGGMMAWLGNGYPAV